MSNPSQLHGASHTHFLVVCAAIGSSLVGVFVLLGWGWDVPHMKSVVPQWVEMAPNTALSHVLGGVALGLLHPSTLTHARRAVGSACALGLLLIGGFTLIQELHLLDLDFQDLFFGWMNRTPQTPLPLTAPSTACCFVLLGAALLLLGRSAPVSALWMDILIILTMLITLFEFNSKLHGVLTLANSHQLAIREGMGLHTSLVIMLLGTGILCARPHQGLMGQLTRDTLGGFLARRLVPVSIMGPPLVGAVLELFHREEFFSIPAKFALFSTVMSMGGVGIVFLSARALNRIDAERRQASASLKASEERFRSLLETAPDAVVTLDDTGHVRFMNAQVERLFGYPREEMLGQTVERLIPELLRKAHLLQSESSPSTPIGLRSGEGVTLRARNKNGAEIPVDVTLSPRSTPEGLAITAVIRDVTERERYLESLQLARAEAEKERALLQAVVDHAPIGIFFVDPSTDEVRFNSSLLQMMGEPESLRAERRKDLLRLQYVDGRPVLFEELPSTRALEGHVVTPEKYFIPRVDRQLPVLASAAPVRGLTGEVRSVIVCIQDISTHEELERLREEYVGLISHDLRTPLQNISLRSQLLLRSLKEKGLATEVSAAEALLRNTRRMSGMVEELLEGSRLEAGKAELHRESLDVRRFLEEVIERSVPPDTRERLRLEVSTPLQWIPADALRLERVLVNLLTNALKYSDPGTPVVVRLEEEAGHARISVKDQGKGLRPEEIARLFTKYYRTRDGERVEGVGLGLYISRLIIEAHGGHIGVESTLGQGSTFSFTLPLSKSTGEEGRPEDPHLS